jgi:hypothetical protein
MGQETPRLKACSGNRREPTPCEVPEQRTGGKNVAQWASGGIAFHQNSRTPVVPDSEANRCEQKKEKQTKDYLK